MVNVLSINLGNFGSTGNIANHIREEGLKEGFNTYFAYPNRPENIKKSKNDIVIKPFFSYRVSRFLERKMGFRKYINYFSTMRLIKKIRKYDIKIVHLHNLHGSYLNLELLFNFLKKENIAVVWTLHDCWAFTGRCPHFQISKCKKWEKGCFECNYPKDLYPSTQRDRSNKMWLQKKKWFSGLNNMTIVTPSKWLSHLVRRSFLGIYPLKVINNGIDLNIFKLPKTDCRDKVFDKYLKSDEKNNIKYLILGVAFDWSNKKGLDIFISLSKILPNFYKIILIGTTEKIDKELPNNIISIHRTHDKNELSEIYGGVDVFVNPTREENFPTVNMEALGCGCPVVSFDTGGCSEIISDTTGLLVEDDANSVASCIINVCENNIIDKKDCVERAKSFDMNSKFKEYISLYKEILLH